MHLCLGRVAREKAIEVEICGKTTTEAPFHLQQPLPASTTQFSGERRIIIVT